MYSTLNSQQKALQIHAHRLARADIQRRLNEMLYNADLYVANYWSEKPGQTFATAATIKKFELLEIYESSKTNGTPPLIVKSGKDVINMFGLKVTNILLTDWVGIGPTPMSYKVNLEIHFKSFDQDIKPIKVEGLIVNNAPASSGSILAAETSNSIYGKWFGYPKNAIVQASSCKVTTDADGKPTMQIGNTPEKNPGLEYSDGCYVSPNGISYNGYFNEW